GAPCQAAATSPSTSALATWTANIAGIAPWRWVSRWARKSPEPKHSAAPRPLPIAIHVSAALIVAAMLPSAALDEPTRRLAAARPIDPHPRLARRRRVRARG